MIGTMVLVLMGCGSAVFAGSMAGTVGAGVGTVGGVSALYIERRYFLFVTYLIISRYRKAQT